MNTMDRILALEEQEQKIGAEVEVLSVSLNHDKWGFYINTTQYDNPRISALRPGGSILLPASFIVKGDSVEVYDISIYQEDWQEAEAIIKEWLNRSF